MAKIAVGIINFNTRDLLRSCLISIQPEVPGKIVVIDNASSDGSANIVKTEFPDVFLIENRRNIGYGAAANQAIAACESEHMLLLNSDTVLHPGALNAIFEFLQSNPRTAIVGPGLVNPDGTLQRSCFPFPTPADIFMDVSGAGRLIHYVPLFKDRYLRTWKHDRVRPAPWILGAALGIRCEAFRQAGGFDEMFFMYYEEVDLCYRLKKAGWEILFTPSAKITHTSSASTGLYRTEMILHLYASLEKFYQKHYSRLRQIEFTVMILCIAWARLARDRLLIRRASDEQLRVRLSENIKAWRLLATRSWNALATGFPKSPFYDLSRPR